MGRRETARQLVRALIDTARARARRGPVRPGWSLIYETAALAARRTWSQPRAIAERRTWFDQIGATLPTATVHRRRVRLGDREAEWQVPDGLHAHAPVVLYLHGGGYGIGSVRSHRPLTTHLAHIAQLRLISLDYRLAPEHPCPSAVEDAVAAYRALRHQGVAANQIAIAGDSAGGGLVLSTLLALRDDGDALPLGGILLSPWVDLRRRPPATEIDYILEDAYDFYVPGFRGPLPSDDWRVSPICADLTGLPPLLLIAGGEETLLPDSLDLADRARQAGVDCTLHVEPHEIHVFPYYASMNPRARAAMTRIGSWIGLQR